ncbi:MAG: hypothetical protein P4L59_07100 [Desulfosporosinus sp.]|nr:hypothetical protein [Desulfosporosinus sp.]
MTILNRTINRKRVKKSFLSVILSVVLVLLIETCYPGTALAGGIVDVVTEVANKNYQSPEFKSGAEDVTGHGFNMNAGYGGYANGHGGISVLGPVDSGDMSILLSYVDGETQNTNIQTTRMNGGEVREYTMEDGIGVGVVLPDYFITVETYQSGNSSTIDFQKAKSIAQQVLDGMEKNGLLSQPAPDIINPSAAKPAKTVPVTSSVVTGNPLDEPIPISDTNNIAGVGNGPTAPTTFTIKTPHLVTFIQNYHWNSGKGASPGKIGLTDQKGIVYGPWQAAGKPGQGGVPNAYWEVSPNVVIPVGTYTVTDSSSASWSANTESGGRGMSLVRATPNYKVNSGSVDNLTGKISGGTTDSIDNTESPAGVGSVGTIPGPSNTTEAIVGVAVPGIIAVSLGALAGLGGGGFAPHGGTTQSPNAGGTAPGGAGNYPGPGTPGRGTNPTGAVLDTNQLGRRRREEISIDTDEMGQGSIIMPGNDGTYIENTDEAGVFIQTEQLPPSLITDATDTDILIDTSAFDGPSPARTTIPESGIDIGTESRNGVQAGGRELDGNGYNPEGYDQEGFDREGFDVNGYNAKGYNRSGYNPKGYNAAGYNKNGFNEDGWDKEGFGKDGLDKAGFDHEGYDKAGYDKNGYNREGYDREGRQQEGYDEQGYDKNGFNKDGFDRDGCDREGFNYEGYNRAGYDPWGYDKNGYGKDGYHWSGYNADGYDRNGRHWDKNPFEGDGNPFNVGRHNPFEDDREVLPYGTTWKATKPPLGEPYPKTLDKYGAKPWTDEPQVPEQVKNTDVSKPGVNNDAGFVPGPEDPQGTLKNHDVGTGNAPQTPNESSTPDNQPENSQDTPSDQQVETGDANTFTYIDPETGKTTTYEYEPGYTGPRQGETQILVGKTDGQTYNLKFDAVKGKWVNTESGNEFNPETFESWQNNLAIDKQRTAHDLEIMTKRQDANSKAIDQNLADWNKLDQMQKAADKYNIGEPGGPEDVDNTIQKLKDDMLAGKQLDQSKVDQIRRVIDNRIMGKTSADNGESWEEVPWYQDIDSALKANAATVKEVVTAEKDDGSISWLGMGARIMITAASGGITYVGQVGSIAVEIGSGVVMDGAMTVTEAMYRMKDSIDKGESDFSAASKAVGMTVLGEEMGWLAGEAGGKLMNDMMEKFPVFSNKAGDFLEVGLLKIMKANQIASKGLGIVGKESAEDTLKQIQKRITELGADSTEQSIDKSTSHISRVVAGSSDDIARGGGKAVSNSTDDIAKGEGRATSEGSEEITRSVKTGDASKTPDVPDHIPEGINRGARTPEQVLDDPAAMVKAEKTMQANVKDYDKLPPNRQQELVREQVIYDEYKRQAEEKTWNISDKVQRQEDITVEDILEMKADPASMRTLKNIEQVDGLGAELGTGGSRQVQTKFNDVLNENVYQPSYRDVESHLSGRYNGAEIRVQTVRTPKAGQECNPWDINTDNDIVAQRLVNGPNGPEWVEIPRGEWEKEYYESYAKHTGFTVDQATSRFPNEKWSGMTEPQQVKKWAELHGEEPADVGMLAGGRDFSNQRTAMLNGERPMREATPRELERGIESVTIDGKEMVPVSTSELVQRGQTTLLDSEQLSMMEKYKINEEWNKLGSPADIMKNQTESMEQLSKAAEATQGLENSYRNMGFKVEQMPDNMQQAIKVVKNNSLSPAARAARLQELGYPTPGDFVEKVTSRMGAIRAARR